jgi:hypothetical protein
MLCCSQISHWETHVLLVLFRGPPLLPTASHLLSPFLHVNNAALSFLFSFPPPAYLKWWVCCLQCLHRVARATRSGEEGIVAATREVAVDKAGPLLRWEVGGRQAL